MKFVLGIKTILGRRRSEQRIRRRTRRASRKPVNTEADIDRIVQPYIRRAGRIANKVVNTTQDRKAEGKVVLKGWIKHGIGVSYRGLVGSKRPTQKKRGRK